MWVTALVVDVLALPADVSLAGVADVPLAALVASDCAWPVRRAADGDPDALAGKRSPWRSGRPRARRTVRWWRRGSRIRPARRAPGPYRPYRMCRSPRRVVRLAVVAQRQDEERHRDQQHPGHGGGGQHRPARPGGERPGLPGAVRIPVRALPRCGNPDFRRRVRSRCRLRPGLRLRDPYRCRDPFRDPFRDRSHHGRGGGRDLLLGPARRQGGARIPRYGGQGRRAAYGDRGPAARRRRVPGHGKARLLVGHAVRSLSPRRWHRRSVPARCPCRATYGP